MTSPADKNLYRGNKLQLPGAKLKNGAIPGVHPENLATGVPHATVGRVDRVVQIFRSFEDADRADDEFYASLKPQERLDMLLELIEQHRGALGEAADRFERVHCITELSQR